MSMQSGYMISIKHLMLCISLVICMSGCSSLQTQSTETPLEQYLHRYGKLQTATSEQELNDWVTANDKYWNLPGKEQSSYLRMRCPLIKHNDEESDSKWNQQQKSVKLDCVYKSEYPFMMEARLPGMQSSELEGPEIAKVVGENILILRGDYIHNIQISSNEKAALNKIQSIQLQRELVGHEVLDGLTIVENGVLAFRFNFKGTSSSINVLTWDKSRLLKPAGIIEIEPSNLPDKHNKAIGISNGKLLYRLNVDLNKSNEWVWQRWRSVINGKPGAWHDLIDPSSVLMPVLPVFEPRLYAVLQCDLDKLKQLQMQCQTHGVISEGWSHLYVSETAAYIASDTGQNETFEMDEFSPYRWQIETDKRYRDLRQVLIYRFPLDSNESPGITGMAGSKGIFREIGDQLIALDELSPDPSQRLLGMYRIPLKDFKTQVPKISEERWLVKAISTKDAYVSKHIHDDSILVGESSELLHEFMEIKISSKLTIQDSSSNHYTQLKLLHSVDRFESMEEHILLSGKNEQGIWYMSLLDITTLTTNPPMIVDRYSNWRTLSNDYNWKKLNNNFILMVLPGKNVCIYRQDMVNCGEYNSVSDLVFFTYDGQTLREAGIINMQTGQDRSSDCIGLNCSDWYTNARTVFVDDRIFVLSGNQFAEAHLDNGHVRKLRQVELQEY
ncbi:MAG: hypothetical protein PF630_06065 [Gammaproteobacteria bacterium]|jgi:uncharacterized protein YceK|nr:hypothetical protein [Gammaproteobacteria bacterium]